MPKLIVRNVEWEQNWHRIRVMLVLHTRYMKTVIDRKPSSKDVDDCRKWEIEMAPLRALCVELGNQRNELLRKSYVGG